MYTHTLNEGSVHLLDVNGKAQVRNALVTFLLFWMSAVVTRLKKLTVPGKAAHLYDTLLTNASIHSFDHQNNTSL